MKDVEQTRAASQERAGMNRKISRWAGLVERSRAGQTKSMPVGGRNKAFGVILSLFFAT
jgi:hypothetical protein